VLSLNIHWRFQVQQGLGFADDLWISSDVAFFYNSMHEPWLYFCYRFDASVVNSLTFSITYVWCHSVFIDDFKFKKDFIFANDLWINCDIMLFTIPCVSHESIFAFNLMRQLWIPWRCRLHTSAVTQYSLMISSSTRSLFSLTIYGSVMTQRFWQFHASAMTHFLLSIWCIGREFIDTVDYIRLLSLNIHWWFQVQ